VASLQTLPQQGSLAPPQCLHVYAPLVKTQITDGPSEQVWLTPELVGQQG
jgi:hypothetical protein